MCSYVYVCTCISSAGLYQHPQTHALITWQQACMRNYTIPSICVMMNNCDATRESQPKLVDWMLTPGIRVLKYELCTVESLHMDQIVEFCSNWEVRLTAQIYITKLFYAGKVSTGYFYAFREIPLYYVVSNEACMTSLERTYRNCYK